MRTDIIVLLDRSGSMSTIRSDTIGGFNDFLRTQQEQAPNATLTLAQFNEGLGYTVFRTPVGAVSPLTESTYKTEGYTALVDAQARTIVKLGEEFAKLPDDKKPERVIFFTITDGEENSSREYTIEALRSMIKEQQEKWKWDFVYMGADHDVYAQSGSMGISATNAGIYNKSDIRSGLQVNSMKIARAAGPGGQSVSMAYTDDEKAAMLGGNGQSK